MINGRPQALHRWDHQRGTPVIAPTETIDPEESLTEVLPKGHIGGVDQDDGVILIHRLVVATGGFLRCHLCLAVRVPMYMISVMIGRLPNLRVSGRKNNNTQR